MSVAELKEKLIHQIEKSDDVSLLEDINRLLQVEENTLEFFKLDALQIKRIVEAREQTKNEDLLTSDDADREIDEWLTK